MKNGKQSFWRNEDWWSVWFGFLFIIASLSGLVTKVPRIGKWTNDPLAAFGVGSNEGSIFLSLLLLMLGLGVVTTIGVAVMKNERPDRYFAGFVGIFVLSCFACWIADQANIKYWGLSYALWALLVGLLVSNTLGSPRWLLAGVRTEMYIKTGLVLLGAEILFKKIVALGAPGLMVAWIVTPVVVVFMFAFATRVLKMTNKKLAMIISCATSVCGVSAAIAAAAACRARKEDLTLAVGITLIFTVLMMVLMPLGIKWLGMDTVLGAAWMGGTIDSTGAVVAAGSMLGPAAERVAAVVKMIQNVLIGLMAFLIALYWVTRVERVPGHKATPMEIWYRFPRFVIGFVAASILFSFVVVPLTQGDFKLVETTYINPVTKVLRGWFFCMAFVSIGLETNFRDLVGRMEGGKPLILYVVGQSFNLVLTLLVAWLAFIVLFPHAVQ